MKPTIYYEIITADKIRSQRIKTTKEKAPNYLRFRIAPGVSRTYKLAETSVISCDVFTDEPTEIMRTYREELVEADVLRRAHNVVVALLAAFAVATIAAGKIDAIDRELDAAERAAAVPTHPNFGRAK